MTSLSSGDVPAHEVTNKPDQVVSASSRLHFFIFLMLRVTAALMLRTSFHPDEYFQTVEPAFNLAHSDSSCIPTPTWEWKPFYQLRSHVSIMPYYLLFIVEKHFHALVAPHLSPFIVHYLSRLITPRVLQSVFVAISDTCFYDLIADISGPSVAWVAICLHLCSWSLLFCLPRTLANSTELVLCIIVAWFWRASHNHFVRLQADDTGNHLDSSGTSTANGGRSDYIKHRAQWGYEALATSLTVLAVYSRPTSFLLLAPLALASLSARLTLQSSSTQLTKQIVTFLGRTGLVAAITASLCLLIDIWGYDSLRRESCEIFVDGDSSESDASLWSVSIPPLNFVRVNFFENMSAQFGVHSWHWHFTQVLHCASEGGSE